MTTTRVSPDLKITEDNNMNDVMVATRECCLRPYSLVVYVAKLVAFTDWPEKFSLTLAVYC
jgi:hypothetical protein